MQRDLYKEVSDKIAAQIENGIAQGDAWRLPWRRIGLGGRAVNAVSGHVYRGVNTVMLWAAADEAGYSNSRWATFKQWTAKGARVRKGEKGSMIVFFKTLDVHDRSKPEDPAATVSIPFLRSTYVFNVAQVEGFEDKAASLTDRTNPVEAADAFVAKSGAVIRHGSDQAYYRPSTDEVVMPNRAQFIGDADMATQRYYSTLLHELTHWTGHKTRLDRLNDYVGEGRAFEELIAELGAAFLCADLGVSNEPRDDHGQYLAGWLKVIKSDPRAFFKAASAAEKACDFLKACDASPMAIAA